jgi:hypothetical protein
VVEEEEVEEEVEEEEVEEEVEEVEEDEENCGGFSRSVATSFTIGRASACEIDESMPVE